MQVRMQGEPHRSHLTSHAPRFALIALIAVFMLSTVLAVADEAPSTLETELEMMLKHIIEGCNVSNNADACIVEKIEKKRTLYESFLDKTAPAAWPDVDIISFTYFHVVGEIAKEQVRCNAMEASEKQTCLQQVPMLISDARDHARHLLIAKGEAYGKRQAAAQNARRLDMQQQEYERQMELARIQAAGQALLGLGIGGGLFRNTTAPTAPLYQPSPVPALPFAAPTAPVPPVSCSSRQVGSVVHTDCY